MTRPPTTWVDRLFRGIDLLLAALLLGMVLMVFGNVVLRYAFNTGILVSEELSRYFFVWITFIGAVTVMRDRGHLGMDSVVDMLGPRGRHVAAWCNHLIVLGCCVVMAWGTWRQHDITASTTAPITGMSMVWVFGVAYFTALSIGLMTLHRLWRLACGLDKDEVSQRSHLAGTEA
jgi:TRAP-type transport system small permease protein